MQRREEAEEHARADRQRGGERHHLRVQRGVDGIGRFARDERHHQVQRPPRDDEARGPSEGREQQRLREQLTNELPARRADRQPHRHLAGARRRSREQQAGDVRARDQEHESRDAEEQRQRAARRADHAALALRSRQQLQRLRAEPLHRLLAHALLQRRLDIVDDVAVRHAHRRLRLFERDARFEPREQIGPIAPAIVEAFPARRHEGAQCDRHVQLRLGAERRAVEALRRDADDGQRLAVDDQLLIENVRVLAEARLPEGVTEHRDARLADRRVIVWREQAAERGREPQHREVAAGDHHAPAVRRLIARRDVRAEDHVRGDTGEAGRAVRRLLEVPVHRIAEDVVAIAFCAREAARVGSGLRGRRQEVHEPSRIGNRQRPQEHLIEQRKDRGVCADPERQRGDGDDGDERRLEERPQSELEIGHG